MKKSKKSKSTADEDVDEPVIIPAVRDEDDVDDEATSGLPPGAYDPRKDSAYKAAVKPIQRTKRREVSAFSTWGARDSSADGSGTGQVWHRFRGRE